MADLDDIEFSEEAEEMIAGIGDEEDREEVRNRCKIDALSGTKMGQDPVVEPRHVVAVKAFVL